MAKTLQDLYQEVVNLSDAEKLALGAKSASIVVDFLSRNLKDSAGVAFAVLVGTYVGIDGRITLEEYAFCKAALHLDLTPEQFNALVVSSCTPEAIELTDKLIDASPAEVKTAFVMLGIAIFSIDDNISAAEQALLAKYIA